MRLGVLSIGDELLYGEVVDTMPPGSAKNCTGSA